MLRETKTENGRVRGVVATDARITVYKGIPFAADTSGENRWRPPQPAMNWEGVRDCSEFGPIPMQRTPGADPEAFYAKEWHVDPEVPMGEDCLRANIWTPAKSVDEKLPVMVWIFGGGLQEGYPHEMEFDGERIASRGVILVSIGYRVNVFGLLCHPEITAENPEAPANFAFQDQAYGIAWVKRNIANFGGDPDNITIFGQSAGGFSVLAQMCSPKTEGLFQKGIIESIGGMNPITPTVRGMSQDPLELMEQRGVEFFKKLGVSSLAEARKLDSRTILNKFYEDYHFWGACIDGKFLTKTLDETVALNEYHNIPFMIGNTKDEFLVTIPGDDEASVDAYIDKEFGDKADEYRAIVKAMPGDYRTNATVHQMWLGNLMMDELAAKQGRTFYTYVFGPTIPGDNAGSFHSCDLWFQFETLLKCWRPFDGHHLDLSRKMCNYWTNFAKFGDPNGNDKDGTPMPTWTPYTVDSPYAIHFYDEISMEDTPRDEKTQFLLDLNLKNWE